MHTRLTEQVNSLSTSNFEFTVSQIHHKVVVEVCRIQRGISSNHGETMFQLEER